MENIITEIAQKFIKNICEELCAGKSITEIEPKMLAEAKKCATELTSAYISAVDTQILVQKSARRESGHSVYRRGDERKQQTAFGEVRYNRTYYKKASGDYEYLTDTFLGINSRKRVSEGLSLSLASAAKDMSYQKATNHLTSGEISRQTVMSRVRKSNGVTEKPTDKRRVPELHIDADEAHISLCGGKKSEVPLISIYEGIESHGKRNKCKNVFHISEYGMKKDDFWERAATEAESRYDLTDTKIYIHGDGASWIQTGFEWFPSAIFVLDKYHKNKAIKAMTAGLDNESRKLLDKEIREALNFEDLRLFDELTWSLCDQMPWREEKIIESAGYLKRFVHGISICVKDPCANNGGCTEPHISHVLAARLSSRPMAWSRQTLKKLAPMLAAGKISFEEKEQATTLPASLRNVEVNVNKAFRRDAAGLPSPDYIGILPISGKITGTQKILKMFK